LTIATLAYLASDGKGTVSILRYSKIYAREAKTKHYINLL